MRVSYNLVRWKQTPCLKYSTPLCYTTRWALTREALLSSHTNDFVVGTFPNVWWPSKEQTSMQKSFTGKHNKKHAFDNVLAICFEGFQSQKFSHLPFCVFTTIFHLANRHGHFIWDAMFLVHWSLTADMWCCLQFYPVCLVFILHA